MAAELRAVRRRARPRSRPRCAPPARRSPRPRSPPSGCATRPPRPRPSCAAVAERLRARRPARASRPAEPLAERARRRARARACERLQRRREQLGPVNPLAQDEYAEALAHVEELEGQRDDLETALRELRALIRDTDRQIEETFEQTFAAAARNFEELVGDVFPGGSGRLRLVEDEQAPRAVLGGQRIAGRRARRARRSRRRPTPRPRRRTAEESSCPGVEIEITPAGKSTKRLTLLSGGEKSMTALAFLFAVFLARPCPFYILDEVEAALDDLNLDRFLALLRRYADRAQFIVITHQKRTMEAADWLYGVSMGGDGVSKVLSRRLPAEDGRPSRRQTGWPERRSPDGAGRRRRSAALYRRAAVARDWSDLFITDDAREAARRASRPRSAAACSAACARAWPRRARRSAARSRRRCSATLDEETWERLEEALIMADVGAADDRGGRADARAGGDSRARSRAARRSTERLIELLAETAQVGEPRIDLRPEPTVIMAVGVNGTGKTTTIGKLAWHLREELGESVLLGAADTFRAAASEQLDGWAAARRLRDRHRRAGLGPGRGRLRGDRAGARQGRRRGDRRHRRAPAHPGRPDGRAREGHGA